MSWQQNLMQSMAGPIQVTDMIARQPGEIMPMQQRGSGVGMSLGGGLAQALMQTNNPQLPTNNLGAARDRMMDAAQTYGNTKSQRFRGGLLGLGESIYDIVKSKGAREEFMDASQAYSNEEAAEQERLMKEAEAKEMQERAAYVQAVMPLLQQRFPGQDPQALQQMAVQMAAQKMPIEKVFPKQQEPVEARDMQALARGLNIDPQDPQGMQKVQNIVAMMDEGLPDEVVEQYMVKNGMIEGEKEAPAKPNLSTYTTTKPDGAEVRVTEDDQGNLVRERVVKPAGYESPEQKRKREEERQEQVNDLNLSLKTLEKYDNFLKDFGYEPGYWGNVESSDGEETNKFGMKFGGSGEAGALYMQARNEIRKAQEMGALQEADIKVLEQSIGDPTSLLGDISGGKAVRDREFLKPMIEQIRQKITDLDPDVIAARAEG